MSERIIWTHHMRGSSWLLIEHIGDVAGFRGRESGVIALVTIDGDGSATAEFAALATHDLARRNHAIAAAARCYAEVHDVIGDMLADGELTETSDDTAELLGCSGGSLGDRAHAPTSIGATVRTHGDGARAALAVHFGYDFADAVMSK